MVEREEKEDTGRLNPNEGSFCRLKAHVCLQQMDYCLLSPKEWVLRASLCPGWPILYPILHLCVSHQPWALSHSVLFAVVLFPSMYLTFVNLFSYETDFSFPSFLSEGESHFLGTVCFVLSEEQVGRVVVTGEEC